MDGSSPQGTSASTSAPTWGRGARFFAHSALGSSRSSPSVLRRAPARPVRDERRGRRGSGRSASEDRRPPRPRRAYAGDALARVGRRRARERSLRRAPVGERRARRRRHAGRADLTVRRPAFMKIDVEGYELEALRGFQYRSTFSRSFQLRVSGEPTGLRRPASETSACPRFDFSEGESRGSPSRSWSMPTISLAICRTRRENMEFFGNMSTNAWTRPTPGTGPSLSG